MRKSATREYRLSILLVSDTLEHASPWIIAHRGTKIIVHLRTGAIVLDLDPSAVVLQPPTADWVAETQGCLQNENFTLEIGLWVQRVKLDDLLVSITIFMEWERTNGRE